MTPRLLTLGQMLAIAALLIAIAIALLVAAPSPKGF